MGPGTTVMYKRRTRSAEVKDAPKIMMVKKLLVQMILYKVCKCCEEVGIV